MPFPQSVRQMWIRLIRLRSVPLARPLLLIANVYFDFSVFSGRSSSATDGVSFLKVQILKRFDKTPIANCKVTLYDINGQEIETKTADLEGNYKSKGIPPGIYKITAEQPGFVTQTMGFQTYDEKTEDNIMELSTE